jgi:hypothetical protein
MSNLVPSNLYQYYKPLRNLFSQFPLEQSLEHIWVLSQHLLNGHPLPDHPSFISLKSQFKTLSGLVYPWELAIILREIIINSSNNGKKSLINYNNLGDAINGVRGYGNQIASLDLNLDETLKALHRIAHLQFPWQRINNLEQLIRYKKIFGGTAINDLVQKQTGLDLNQLMFMGFAARGHLLKFPGFNLEQSYQDFGISPEKSRTFFEGLTIDFTTLKEAYISAQSHNRLWEYTWNPLDEKPLIRMSKNNPNLTYCPLPELFMRRITSGLFYDFVDTKDFGNSYGKSFEMYVGEVLSKLFDLHPYTYINPKPIMQGKKIKHRVDWIVQDSSSSMLIECKTKRIRFSSKIDVDSETLEEDIQILAKYVVQTYKNFIIEQSVDPDRYHFPILVMLDEWYLMSPIIKQFLDTEIKQSLEKSGLNEELLIDYPFTIMSISELESAGQVIQQVGIESFFKKKTLIEYKDWDLKSFCNEVYKEQWKKVKKTLFNDETDSIFSDLTLGRNSPIK